MPRCVQSLCSSLTLMKVHVSNTYAPSMHGVSVRLKVHTNRVVWHACAAWTVAACASLQTQMSRCCPTCTRHVCYKHLTTVTRQAFLAFCLVSQSLASCPFLRVDMRTEQLHLGEAESWPDTECVSEQVGDSDWHAGSGHDGSDCAPLEQGFPPQPHALYTPRHL